MGQASHAAAVLIVDDEQDVLDSFEPLFREHFADVAVATAASGDAALEAMRGTTFDLVLCDFRMPGMDGLEVLAHVVRRSPRTARILMTAFADLDLAVRAVNEGHVDFLLRKPFEVEDLLDATTRALAKSLDEQTRDRLLGLQSAMGQDASRILHAPWPLEVQQP
ncbi:MAG: response regulator [bacterium]